MQKAPWILSVVLMPVLVVSAVILPSAWLVLRFGDGYADTILPRPLPEAMTTMLYDWRATRSGRSIREWTGFP